MYKLTSENMLDVGGPMYMACSHTNWTKYFKKLENAKSYAKKDYKYKETIKFEKQKDYYGRTYWTSGDLGYVMYTIVKVATED